QINTLYCYNYYNFSTFANIRLSFIFFFFTDPSTTEIYTLSLHDALPIYFTLRNRTQESGAGRVRHVRLWRGVRKASGSERAGRRSEEHTSELQSRRDLVCRLLLEKKKNKQNPTTKFISHLIRKGRNTLSF